jgi:predicted ribosomally synthesized peptide with SipW-like signal peptide
MRKILVLSLALIILLGMMSSGTFSYFSSPKNSTGNTFTAWVCPYDSMIIVSGTDTQVTEAYTNYSGGTHTTTYTGPNYAVLAWVHTNWASIDHTFSDGAQWIWETFETDDPGGWGDWPGGWPSSSVTGRVVRFERTFEIPCSPNGAELYITCDNGYQVWVNGNPVGSAQVQAGWESNTLYEAYVNSHGWENVEHYIITASSLVAGTNTLEILAANEYMGPSDSGQSNGTWDTNPAGLIYWLKVEWGY